MYVIQEVDEDALSDRSSLMKERTLIVKKEQVNHQALEPLKEEDNEEELKQGQIDIN